MTTRDGGEHDDVDARFAEIVAHWDAPSPGGTPSGGEHGEEHGRGREAREDREGGHEDARRRGSPDGGTGGLIGERDDPLGDPLADPLREPNGDDASRPRPRRPDEVRGDGSDARPVAGTAPADGTANGRDHTFDEPVPWRTYTPAEDPDDETFTPPPPEPLPAFFTDWPFYLALTGLVLGPLGLVLLVLFAPTERRLMWIAAGLTIAGFVTLVLRQPVDRDPDDTDDGARV